MKRILIALAVVAVFASLLGSAVITQWQPVPTVVHDIKTATITWPSNATLQDHKNLAANMTNGSSLPTAIVVEEMHGRVRGVLTGFAVPSTGEEQLVVTVTDESEDLAEARLYKNDLLIITATRANGMIVDRSGLAVATMDTLVLANSVFSMEVEWVTDTGDEFSHRVEL